MVSRHANCPIVATWLAAFMLIGCGGGEPSPAAPTTGTGGGASMVALDTPEASASVDGAVAKPPAVVVRDGSGHGKSGVQVTFRVVAGGGTIGATTVTSDANGRAGLQSWTLGPTPTDNIVEASADGQTAVRFTVAASWPRRLATSALGACALVATKAYCWGDNSHLELAANFAPAISATPVPALLAVPGTLVEIDGAFGMHLCGITSQRAGYCWGRNDFGQAGATTLLATGIGVAPLGPRAWASLSVGRISTCGVDTLGSGFCWGSNQRGEIGNPATLPSFGPTPAATLVITTFKFKSITAGWEHACGLSTDGTAYCWGGNDDGQLGIDGITGTQSPRAVMTTERFSMLAAGGRFTCGLTLDGRAICWGTNAFGELGDGTTFTRFVPTAVVGGLHFTSIAVGTFFVSAIPPELATFPLAAAPAHTCALTETGQAYCWGWNGWGQLGDGTLQDRHGPTAVLGGLTFNGLSLSESSTCGMRGTTVSCWGGNISGQLGDGTTTRRLQPVRVQLPP